MGDIPKVKTGEKYTELVSEVSKERDAMEDFEKAKSAIDTKVGEANEELVKNKEDAVEAVNSEAGIKNSRVEAEAKKEAGTEPDKEKEKKKHEEWVVKVESIRKSKMDAIELERNSRLAVINADFAALDSKIKALSKSAKAQLDAATKARQGATEKVTSHIAAKMAGDLSDVVDDDEMASIKSRAEFAQDLADDGTLNSYVYDEVGDYLTKKINKRNADGSESTETVEIVDSELENITMGIVSVIHDPENANDDKNPAREFIKRLSEREDRKPKFDQGVDIKDVGLEVMRNMDLPVSKPEERENARNTPQYKLFTDIVTNQDLPPELRGMLIGKLADGKEKDVEKRMQKVQAMLKMAELAQQQQAGKLDQDTIDKIAPYLNTGTGAAIGSLLLGFGAVPGALIAGGYTQGFADEKALTKAGLAMRLLEDSVSITEFENAKAQYIAMKGLTGLSNEEADGIIGKTYGPLSMPSLTPKLEEAVKNLEIAYKKKELKDIKESKEYAHAKALYEHYKVTTFNENEKKLEGLNSKSLAEFKVEIGAIKAGIANYTKDPELMAAAQAKKDGYLKAISAMKNYKEAKEKAAAAGVSLDANQYPEAADFSEMETALTNAQDPSAIKAVTEGVDMPDPIASATSMEANTVALNQATEEAEKAKKVARRGSGGTGTYQNIGRKSPEVSDSVEVTASTADNLRKKYGATEAEKYVVQNPPDWVKKAKTETPKGTYDRAYYEVKNGEDSYGVIVNGSGGKFVYKKNESA